MDSIGNDNENLEKGQCYSIARGNRQVMTLEVRVPIRNRTNAWQRKGIPYPQIDSIDQTPEGIIIKTIGGITVKIKGDNLDRLFDALCDHQLRMVRPILKNETIAEGEPKPYKITIEEEKGDRED